MTLLSERTIKSIRKETWCEGCYIPLPKGSEAARITGKWDGYFSSCVLCSDCHYLWGNREWYDRPFGDDGWGIGDFLEAAKESGFATTAEMVANMKEATK